MTAEDYCLAAWKRGAPDADTSRGFPRGFWPDVARVAVEMALAGSVSILPTIRQTQSRAGTSGETSIARSEPKPRPGKSSPTTEAQRANTAALLATLNLPVSRP